MIDGSDRGLGPCAYCHRPAVITFGNIDHRLCDEHWKEAYMRVGGSVAEYIAYMKEHHVKTNYQFKAS